MKIGVLHPGAMGAALGGALASSGHSVAWFGGSRSDQTRARAEAAGFVEVRSLADLVKWADVILSICPPHAALDNAREIAALRSGGFLYIDANTIAPETMRNVAGMFGPGVVVDAVVTGGPRDASLTVWAAGERAAEVCYLFDGTLVASRRVGDTVGQASAFKILAGLRSKVIPAIWVTLIEAAALSGPEVDAALRAHLASSGYDVDRESARVADRAPKAWRWIAEMEEAAKTLRELGLPAGFSEAAAATYRDLAQRHG